MKDMATALAGAARRIQVPDDGVMILVVAADGEVAVETNLSPKGLHKVLEAALADTERRFPETKAQ
ncbi:MAG: hypothetical protein ACREDU_04730 [Methylocella sp.]